MVAELETERVFSRAEDGTIFNRRMVREASKPVAAPLLKSGERSRDAEGHPARCRTT
jgi:hypothetical protein